MCLLVCLSDKYILINISNISWSNEVPWKILNEHLNWMDLWKILDWEAWASLWDSVLYHTEQIFQTKWAISKPNPFLHRRHSRWDTGLPFIDAKSPVKVTSQWNNYNHSNYSNACFLRHLCRENHQTDLSMNLRTLQFQRKSKKHQEKYGVSICALTLGNWAISNPKLI